MILRSIEIENFGLYSGRHLLDLVPERGRPVVLIGGRNGAGKTTLLEAVRLALYGRRALGFRVAQSEYEDHLRRRLHVDAEGRPAAAGSVGLEFDYAEGGIVQRYRVVRRWSTRGAKCTETLTLEKDGRPVDAVPRDEWHGFLQELIPPGVSQLFFFDGEKIAEIARDDPDEGLAEAVRGLLGIELVGRLRTDLGLFLARHGRGREGDEVAERLQSVVREIKALDARIGDMNQDVAELASRYASHERVAGNLRQRFIAEGGEAANRRARTEAVRDELRDQVRRREGELRELMSGLLPFAAAPRLVHRFGAALAKAADRGSLDGRALLQKTQAWERDGQPARTAAWDAAHWADLGAFLATLSSVDETSVHQIESGERRRLAGCLADLRSEAARAGVIVHELEELNRKLRRTEADLVRASGEAAGPVLDELVVAEQSVGAAEAALKARKEELRGLEYQRANLDRERDRILKSQTEVRAGAARAALATRVAGVLQQYEQRLLDLKLAQLQSEFVARFNHLARKGGFVADVRIDRMTFDATLIDRTGGEIPKSTLSAGEKQIYAVAMLWALARTSGRQLPMIVDTPLARLDSEHRRTIVERYFTEASHQVIVLSTDTEVDEELLDLLRPSISHSYRLDYDATGRATHVIPGYFGDEEPARAVQQA
jgi:DNA sulfur modification protein DndD